ncbi:phosphate/phosphite/phosphonate ABC transporter substrate-binding protein [Phyllobacterium zundukense]|uniref:Phosphate ABC transporter substrate-binding protein n=1 Tax=Phyllobacterium zundukense TaxID=1867719 RepID=A0A2N9W2C0_9HYPH|nr:PhnD/SsuA/transferrin family substrate-binding protein [Phyllobacterium zundukense]ATU91144.1 phosphate ABC transporter substrate-binding protein [Phyllobacterium zundukense]PIO45888.1 phosphate ABC transporter substrate-binding protein [Phyllobacterium zundukense]
MTFVAALPMYDLPERRAEVDTQWIRMRDILRSNGYDAPEYLMRRNADLPAVPGGIKDAAGNVIAPDPATLPPDELDLPTLWRHPDLLITQTCWGPMELGLETHVHLAGQDDYSGIEGGDGEFYSSALVMRRGEGTPVVTPADGKARLPIDLMRQKRLAFNSHDSMSGYLALQRDLQIEGETLGLFVSLVQTGAHRASIETVAMGRADIAAIDCKSWELAQRYDEAASALIVVGWTGRRKGLPFISSRKLPAHLFA